ncbi:MAG: tRNA pseudouridine(38-40) synthase TruA [Bacteroidota bacterium]
MRYFLELSYKGSHYAGFQVQDNAPTVQLEVEKALSIFYKQAIKLTGSSRTDSGVHAKQNFFHFDTEVSIVDKHVYNLNAILPNDIYIRQIFLVNDNSHSRFHATHRMYHYYICQHKDVFAQEICWHYPYLLDLEKLNAAAALLMQYHDFTSFSKRNTQTHTKLCTLSISRWENIENKLVYKVQSNRFLRGMVRALVATQLQVGRGKMSLEDFAAVIEIKNCGKADFSAPAHGLFLMEVGYKFEDLRG